MKIARTDTVVALIVFLGLAALLLALKNPASLDDGLRHFAMARAMRMGSDVWSTGWSGFFSQGYLSTTNADPWFLANIVLIPFTYFSLSTGLHLYTIATLACLIALSVLLFRSFKLSPIASSIFLLVLVFGDAQFLGRFLIARPYSLMTVVALGVLYCLLQKRFILLGVLMTIAALLSQLFVFPLFLCGSALAAFLLTKKYREALRLSFATVIGTAAGLILHPNPWSYISYLFMAFLRIPFLKSIGLSREMQSGIFDVSAIGVSLLFAITVLLVVLHAQHKKSLKTDALLLFAFVTSALFLLFLFWLRAIDLLWPILVMFVAFLYAQSADHVRAVIQRLRLSGAHSKAIFATVAVASVAQIAVIPLVFLRDDATHSVMPYESLSLIPAASRVLNMDWDRFSIYVSLRPDLRYATGIDRTFTYLTDPAVSDSIVTIENETKYGRLPDHWEKTLGAILASYPSDYLVMTHEKYRPLIDALNKPSPFNLQLMSDEGAVAVYRVR